MRAAMSTAGEMPEEGGQLFGSVRQPTPMTGAANSRRRPRTEKTNPATSARERNPKPNIQRSRHRPQVRARCRKGRPAAPGARPPAYRPREQFPINPADTAFHEMPPDDPLLRKIPRPTVDYV